MAKIISFGEILLRLEVSTYNRMAESNNYQVSVGGAELNVAVGLSHLGHETAMISIISANHTKDLVHSYLNKHRISTDYVCVTDNRLGIYYLEKGFGPRASRVSYDRKYSAFSQFTYKKEMICDILQGYDLLHITGINLAIGQNSQENTLLIIKTAHELKIKISFDFNYRPSLIDIETIKPYYQQIIDYVDYLFASKYDISTFLDIKADNFEEVVCRRHQITGVFYTTRTTVSAGYNQLMATGYLEQNVYQSKEVGFDILDRIGGGDAFVVGIIHQLIASAKLKTIVEFGLACAVLKHSLNGDALIVTEDEVNNYIKTKGQGRVER